MARPQERVFDAPVAANEPIPAYKVVEWNEPVETQVAHFDEKTRTIRRDTVVHEKGYMVVFPRGHSIWYRDLEALENAGLGEIVPLIRMGEKESEVSKEHAPPTTRRVIEKA